MASHTGIFFVPEFVRKGVGPHQSFVQRDVDSATAWEVQSGVAVTHERCVVGQQHGCTTEAAIARCSQVAKVRCHHSAAGGVVQAPITNRVVCQNLCSIPNRVGGGGLVVREQFRRGQGARVDRCFVECAGEVPAKCARATDFRVPAGVWNERAGQCCGSRFNTVHIESGLCPVVNARKVIPDSDLRGTACSSRHVSLIVAQSELPIVAVIVNEPPVTLGPAEVIEC